MTAEFLSIIAPIYNERDNIGPLCTALTSVADTLGIPYEIILVNDGSSDDSIEQLRLAAERHSAIGVIDLRRNYGQTAALMAGIDHAKGSIMVLIDADLQNDPTDIPRLIDKLNEGYEVVSGWRVDRKDAAISRNFVSRIANKLISVISGVRLHDYGCTLKAYRSDVIRGVRLYGEMHRFIPIYASWMGARVCELPVTHHPRRAGRSNYGLERTIKVILDLIVVKFLDRYMVKPIYIFGGFGLLAIATSFFLLGLTLYWRFVDGIYMIQTPVPVLAAVTFLLGVVSILMGLLAEILVRIYFEAQQRAPYLVKQIITHQLND